MTLRPAPPVHPAPGRRIAVFYATTFALTHAVTTAYRLQGGSWHSLDTFLVANGIMLIPGLMALVFARWIFPEPRAATLGLRLRPNRWWLFAWLAPPVLMLLTLAVSLLLPGTTYDPTMGGLGARLGFSEADGARLAANAKALHLPPLAGFLLQGLVLGPTLGAVGGLGEELAWRGLLHRAFISWGFWRCTLVTGSLWAIWHLPLTLQGYGYPQHPVLGTAVFVVYALAFAPLMTFVRVRAQSVIAPAILHGTADTTVLLTLALVRGGGDLTTGWGTSSSIAVLAVVDVAIAVMVRRDVRREVS